MPFRFPRRFQPTVIRPSVPVRPAVELLEDRLPPGSLMSAGLPAVIDLSLTAPDSGLTTPTLARTLDLSPTRSAALTSGAVAPVPAADLSPTAHRAAAADQAGNPQSLAGSTDQGADQSLTAGQGITTNLDNSLDGASNEAASSALTHRHMAPAEGTTPTLASGATAAPVGAPDAGVSHSAAVTAPYPVHTGDFGAQPLDQVAAIGLGGSQGADQPPPPPGHGHHVYEVSPNVRANSRFTCTGNNGRIQSETAVAVSGNAVVEAYNDFRGFYCAGNGYQVTGWSYSLDGGQTFTDGGALPGRQSLGGDPELATGPDGTIYLASLWNPLSGMAVLRGTVTDTGINWSNPTVIMTHNEGYDKENIAVDQNTGEIYVTYTRFGSLGSGIGLYTSIDGGLSFQGPFSVVGTGGVQGSVPVVGPNGELYVSYNIGYPSDSGIGFVASYDGGQTFTPARQIAPTTSFAVPGADRSPSFPHMAVDTSGGPFTGNIYVAWQSAIRGNGEAVLTTSQDGGQTWTSPQIINNDGGSGIEWYPTVNVDNKGHLDAFFYSRRANPGTRLTDLYFAQSTDGAQTFSPAFAVTEVPSNWTFSGDGSPVYGDYINAVSDGKTAVVAYADGRDADPDAYFIRVTPRHRIR